MSDPVLITLIATLGTVICGTLGVSIKGMVDGHHARHQVENNHSKNLRDEIDDLRDEMRRGFNRVSTEAQDHWQTTGTELRLIRADLSGIHEHDIEADKTHSRLWAAIEMLRHPFGGGTDKET